MEYAVAQFGALGKPQCSNPGVRRQPLSVSFCSFTSRAKHRPARQQRGWPVPVAGAQDQEQGLER
eukprot:3840397-Prymnesium_polylepis.1